MSQPSRVSIRDVANAAGVSTTTVSHVLNEKGRVEPGTRERVLQVIDELAYVPNRIGQGLVSGRSFILGLSLPAVGGINIRGLLAIEWYSQFSVLASAAAIERGYVLAILPNLETEGDVARFGVDGVLVLEPASEDPRLELLRRSATPHVVVGQHPRLADVPTVVTSLARGGRQLFEHLVSRGSRRIMLMGPPSPSEYIQQMREVGTEVCQAGDAELEMVVLGGTQTTTQGLLHVQAAEAAREALSRPNRVDAIVCLFEGGGATVLTAAQAMGLAVPGDLRVAQDGDDSTTTSVTPAITVLDQHPELQAEAGLDLLIGLLGSDGMPSGGDSAPPTPLTLVVRDST